MIWLFLTPLFIAYAWVIVGSLIDLSKSFPINPDPAWFAQGNSPKASGFKAGLLWHVIGWPVVLFKCKNSKREFGHWCAFVKYPHGHYSSEESVEIAVGRRLRPD